MTMTISRAAYNRLPRINRAVAVLMREEGLLRIVDDEGDIKQRGFDP